MLRQELVERERWVDEDRFRRSLAVYQALPGPEAHELCCWFGMLARGRLGSIAAGLGFMLPGFLLMLAASWTYLHFGVRNAIAAAAFVAVQAAVLGLMIRAMVRICGAFANTSLLAATALTAAVAELLLVPFWIPLLIGGAAAALAATARRALAAPLLVVGIVIVLFIGSHASLPSSIESVGRTLTVAPPNSGELLLTGLAGGLFSFGGAYTAIPVVHDIAVGPRGWMTEAQFLDGLAIGGVLPAPLVIFGTFVGFLGGNFVGAILVTIGIFLPAFGFTLLGHELFERLVDSPRIHAFLDGVAASFAGLVAATTLVLLARVIGLAWNDGVSLARPTSLAIVVVSAAILFLVKSRWTMPAVLAAAAIFGAATQLGSA